MKLYDARVAPNPRVVRMFAAERGAKLDIVKVDLRGGENRQAPFMAKNPIGTLPALELDDGTVLAEITALCEYLDETTPGASLIGATPLERAECRMWTRRIDLNVVEPMTNGFRFSDGLPMFKDRIHCIPAAAADLKAIAQENLTWLNDQMAGREWICGSRFTLADILLFCFLDFGNRIGQPVNPELKWIADFHARAAARPSTEA